MRLVYKATQQTVTVGDLITHEGRTWVVDHAPKPHKPASSGRVTIRPRGMPGGSLEFFAPILGMEWIEREDRASLPPVVIARRCAVA